MAVICREDSQHNSELHWRGSCAFEYSLEPSPRKPCPRCLVLLGLDSTFRSPRRASSPTSLTTESSLFLEDLSLFTRMPRRNLKPASDPSNPAMAHSQEAYPHTLGPPFSEVQTIAPPPPPSAAYAPMQVHQAQQLPIQQLPLPITTPTSNRKRKAPNVTNTPTLVSSVAPGVPGEGLDPLTSPPTVKKNRTNKPWSPAEEQRLKTMRDSGSSWSEIAKVRPDHLDVLLTREKSSNRGDHER